MTINPAALDWLQARALDPETASRMGLYTAERGPDGEPRPDPAGNILVFPYIDGGSEVNAKYRPLGEKRFWQRKDARKTFFNADVLDDPALERGDHALVITEGELDALAAIQSGFPFTVSVPDGAPPARDEQGNLVVVPEGADDVEPEHDEKYRYVSNNWARLEKVKRFILATDGDEPGWRLAQELARRLGRARCSFVTYPQGCKDLNEALEKFGERGVAACFSRAKPFPVKGLYKLSEFPDAGTLRTYSTGFGSLDPSTDRSAPFMQLYAGCFMIVSGLPGGGKTAWTTQLAFNMARLHGWRAAIASFEMRVTPTLRDMLRGFYIAEARDLFQNPSVIPDDFRASWAGAEVRDADAFIEEFFSFIALDPRDDDTEADCQWVIDRAADAVIRDGANMLIVDPWNEVEHRRRGNESVADYTNRAIRSFKRFASSYDVCTAIVAHPTKAAALSAKAGDKVSLYDISDGATWANKAEFGIIVSRQSPQDRLTEIGIRKVKFWETGRLGDLHLTFDDRLRAFV
jgi:twinkle protein